MKNSFKNPGLLLAIGVFFVSWASILIRLCQSDPTSIAFFRMFFSTIMVLLYLPFYHGGWFIQRRYLVLSILSGILLGLHFYTWVASLKYTSIASSVVLVTTQPIFVAILGYFILRENIGITGIFCVAMAIGGSYIVAHGDFDFGADYLRGDILALLGALFAGSYLFIGRVVRPHVNLAPYITIVYTVSAIVIAFLGTITGSLSLPARGIDYIYMFLMALGPTILGHNLYNYALRHLPAFPVGMSILGEPVFAIIWAIIIFAEMPSLYTFVGGIIILLAVTLVMLKLLPERGAIEA